MKKIEIANYKKENEEYDYANWLEDIQEATQELDDSGSSETAKTLLEDCSDQIELRWKSSQSVYELLEELTIYKSLLDMRNCYSIAVPKITDLIDFSSLPANQKYLEILNEKTDMLYVWTVDDSGYCLTGLAADKVEHMDEIMNANQKS